MIYLLFAIAIIVTAYYLLKKYCFNSQNTTPSNISTEEKTNKSTTYENYALKYQAKYLLTKNEWYEYKKLHEIAQKYKLQICPKVRLADIIEPRKGIGEWQKLFYKIQAKHIDFLICDKNLRVLAILELDDNSHNNADRQERDQFVDQILTSVGYTVIRTLSITEESLSPILNKPTLAPGAHGGQG